MAILDWSVGPTYIMKLLGCQHEQKPSVQQLVKAVTGDFLVRLAEPSVRPKVRQYMAIRLILPPEPDHQAERHLAS